MLLANYFVTLSEWLLCILDSRQSLRLGFHRQSPGIRKCEQIICLQHQGKRVGDEGFIPLLSDADNLAKSIYGSDSAEWDARILFWQGIQVSPTKTISRDFEVKIARHLDFSSKCVWLAWSPKILQTLLCKGYWIPSDGTSAPFIIASVKQLKRWNFR